MRNIHGESQFAARGRRIQGVSILSLMIGAAALIVGSGAPARADDSATVDKLEKEIRKIEAQHEAEIRSLRVQIKEIQLKKTAGGGGYYSPPYGNGGPVVKGPLPCAPFVTMTPGHEFGLSDCNGDNTINFTGRLHLDTGGYANYSHFGGFGPTGLASGVNFRRARIGVQGKFAGDWNYALIYDFGGSSDGFSSTGAAAAATLLSGGGVSGIENAFVTYNGFYNHHQPFPVAITIGAIDVPWTLGEATSSNDILMLERPTPQVFATAFGGGDFRTALGAISNDKNYFLGAWLTGPTTGALHTVGATNLGPQFSALARAAYTLTWTQNGTAHIGANYAYTFDPRAGSNLEALSLSDRPEFRVDPTTFAATGTVPARSGEVFGGEAAASYENAFIQGEYFHYLENTRTGTAAGTLAGGTAGPAYNFNGGYAQASYSFGGHRHYNPATGGYSGVIPDKPLAWGSDGFGAVEAVGTFSIVDTNDSALTALAGGGGGYTTYSATKQTAYGGGLNWYPNLNLKFMLDYEHIIVNKYGLGVASTQTGGARIDWVGARTQFVW